MNEKVLYFYYNIGFYKSSYIPCPNNCGSGGIESCVSGLIYLIFEKKKH